jgi:hypothetical protein
VGWTVMKSIKVFSSGLLEHKWHLTDGINSLTNQEAKIPHQHTGTVFVYRRQRLHIYMLEKLPGPNEKNGFSL